MFNMTKFVLLLHKWQTLCNPHFNSTRMCNYYASWFYYDTVDEGRRQCIINTIQYDLNTKGENAS